MVPISTLGLFQTFGILQVEGTCNLLVTELAPGGVITIGNLFHPTLKVVLLCGTKYIETHGLN